MTAKTPAPPPYTPTCYRKVEVAGDKFLITRRIDRALHNTFTIAISITGHTGVTAA